MEDRQIVYSAFRCPDGHILESMYRHDYVDYRDADDNYFMLDGGNDYQRYSIPPGVKVEWLTVFADEPFEKVRQFATRSGYGKDGKGQLRHTKLKDMTDEYLNAVLSYNFPIQYNATWHLNLIKKELAYRTEHNITIQE